MSDAPVVLFERLTPAIALVTLNRPEKHNAINQAIAERMAAIVQEVEADPTLLVVILAANGPTFCAGADLADVAQGKKVSTAAEGFAGFVKARRTKPWIAAVDGKALGGGFELLLACEMAVISSTSLLGLPEVKRGIMAAAGGAFRIARALPRAIANEVVATGLPISAERALHFGVVNRVVEPGTVLAAARALADDIAVNAPLSVIHSLQLAGAAPEQSEAALWDMTTRAMQIIGASADAKEGPRAFLEKRAPNWQGK